MSARKNSQKPLIVHIVNRLAIGGLETVLVELINHMPDAHYRHAIVCITEATDFKKRITRSDVGIFELRKRPGHEPGLYRRAWTLLRQLKPALVHTYNIGGMELAVVARVAGVRCCVHAEHGRDASDPLGRNWKYNALRKVSRVFIDRWIAVSMDLHAWMADTLGVSHANRVLVYNGVATGRFRHDAEVRRRLRHDLGFTESEFVIGTIGRLDPVKNQALLIDAFADLRQRVAGARDRLRLVIVGDGPLRGDLQTRVAQAEIQPVTWMPGARNDVADILKALDLFVLPSIAEGVPMTILEAMATSRPVVATAVGGNAEVVLDNETGFLVPNGDAAALSAAIGRYVDEPSLIDKHGAAARIRVEQHFSIEAMTAKYTRLYDGLLLAKARG